jgi:hypothetical protein
MAKRRLSNKKDASAKDQFSFRAHYNIQEKLIEPGARPEPDDLLTHITGSIRAFDFETEESDIEAGHLEMYFLDVERADLFHTAIHDVCDAYDSDLEGHVSTFYDTETDELNEDLDIDPFTHNSLILQYLLIPHRFRGLGLGKVIIDSVVWDSRLMKR